MLNHPAAEAYSTCLQYGPDPELEVIISKSSHYSHLYAQDVLKGRFELGENAISKSAYCSYFYALNVIKGRFKLCENYLYDYLHIYCENIIKFNHD